MFGSDPEFFIVDKDGTPVSAHKFFPPKNAPLCRGDGSAELFRDGYVLELNVQPRSCRQEFAGAIQRTLKEAQKHLPVGYSLRAVPSMKISRKDLVGAPDDVMLFGCDPSADAYTGEDKTINLNGMTHLYRYAGGHLHYSDPSAWIKDRKSRDLCVKMLDLYLGVPFTFLFNSLDEFRRRRYYGQAGEYRFQKYPYGGCGIEYRVLSPRVMNNPALLSLCTGILRHVVTNFDTLRANWDTTIERKVQRAINTGFGLVELLPTLDRFYTPELLMGAAGAFSLFDFPTEDVFAATWGEWIRTCTGRPLALYRGDKNYFNPLPNPHFWYA